MCGRYTQTRDVPELQRRFRLAEVRTAPIQRFNIAPSQDVPVVLDDDGRVLDAMRWGLIASFAKKVDGLPQPINARCESLSKNGLFRRLLPFRRCLLVADGFYEWSGGKGDKRPLRFVMKSEEPFAFAGLWDAWVDPARPDGPAVRTCTIITTAANALVKPIHDRMPVILRPSDEDVWLDPSLHNPARLHDLLTPYDPEAMRFYPVSKHVNDARFEERTCIEPLM